MNWCRTTECGHCTQRAACFATGQCLTPDPPRCRAFTGCVYRDDCQTAERCTGLVLACSQVAKVG